MDASTLGRPTAPVTIDPWIVNPPVAHDNTFFDALVLKPARVQKMAQEQAEERQKQLIGSDSLWHRTDPNFKLPRMGPMWNLDNGIAVYQGLNYDKMPHGADWDELGRSAYERASAGQGSRKRPKSTVMV